MSKNINIMQNHQTPSDLPACLCFILSQVGIYHILETSKDDNTSNLSQYWLMNFSGTSVKYYPHRAINLMPSLEMKMLSRESKHTAMYTVDNF